MTWLCLGLIPTAFLISLPLTAALVRAGHALGTYDSAGVAGQVKAEPRRVPNTGGVAIFWGVAAPMLLGLGWLSGLDPAPNAHGGSALLPADVAGHVAGIQQQTGPALMLLGALLLLHIVGMVDDRRPLGPWTKLAIMAAPAVLVPILTGTRLLTMMDAHVGGPWLSVAITALWFLVVTNALNFMDNMDGLAGGVAAVAASCFLAATLVRPEPQWFVAACLALLVGACLGFLAFNAPWPAGRRGAKIFMGDGGSLVLGFLLAFLTVRTTYAPIPDVSSSLRLSVSSSAWYALFMPLVVLAVPIYDFVAVVLIRLSQGKSPFVGDLQHLSHRLVQRGLSKAPSVYVIWGLTAVTGVSGVLLASSRPWQAALIGIQVVALLLVIGLFEYASTKGRPA
ncbi:MAG: undecaprenyl/decaprenyl-phosphate alpha-N-acetylglucosaminyl 1-phosphate transferase [Phycisphaerales bacterium]|nr:undecaprenyl/decaprenyl-phosphate alpha-N-acetylglucosaminyl 1-phosphate transferase [Phycisphaerales bacterium]